MSTRRRMSSIEAPISSDPLLLVGGMSRSGTTLVTTVLDAHPELSIAAELIPGPIDSPKILIDKLDTGLSLAGGCYPKAGVALSQGGDYPVGIFFTRCARSGITAEEVRDVLKTYGEEMIDGIATWRERLTIAWAMIRKRWQRDKTAMFGFKLNTAAIDATAMLFPNARFICVLRDPYDVLASQIKKGFPKKPEEIILAWRKVCSSYSRFCEQHPDRGALIRYEDLVRSPRRTLEKAFRLLPLDFDPKLVKFQESQAELLIDSGRSPHPNLENLRRGFFLESLGVGRRTLPKEIITAIDQQTADISGPLGYARPGYMRTLPGKTSESYKIDQDVVAAHRRRFEGRRVYNLADYDSLLAPYVESHKILRLCDYVRLPSVGDDKILLIRHDIDHDIEHAVRVARWESSRGIRATYCILHTAWYYGIRRGNRYQHSDLLIESVEEILDLGHEINFHNNLLTLSLREEVDPEALLDSELEFWDLRGVPIVGSATHGDRLCHDIKYVNSEFFSECIEDRFGGARELKYASDDGRSVTRRIPVASMERFGLEYEAYEIGRDIRHSDSGGRLVVHKEPIAGRRPFGRVEGRGQVVGILMHPVWWDLRT